MSPDVQALLEEIDLMASGLIYDRTYDDVSEIMSLSAMNYIDMTAEQKQKIGNPHKGAYGPSDMNRIGAFCNKFVEFMAALGYITPSYETMRTDWESTTDPLSSELNRYIEWLQIFRAKWDVVSTTFQNDISLGITLDTCNNIERMLSKSLEVYVELLYTNRYCGTLYCAQNNQWIGGT